MSIMVFWTLAAVMTGLVLIALLWPLARPKPAEGRAHFDGAVYRDQLAEIERDAARGLIGEAEANAARTEIGRRLLASQRQDGAGAEATRRRGWAVGLGVVVPLAAFAAYISLGAPELAGPLPELQAASGPSQEQIEAAAAMSPEERQEMIEGMVSGLAARMEETPEDVEGWVRLGGAYRVLGRSEEAIAALERAQALAPNRVDVLGALTDAHMDGWDGEALPEAVMPLLQRMLLLNPEDIRALLFLGHQAALEGEVETAREHWGLLLTRLPPGSPEHAAILEQLDALDAR